MSGKGEAPERREGSSKAMFYGQEPLLCIQHPGEVLYFGDHIPHAGPPSRRFLLAEATCNLADFVLGFGAQGRTEGWPLLHRAAHRGDLEGLQHLLEANVDFGEAKEANHGTLIVLYAIICK